jgi:cytochrome c oxidase subunit 2
VVVDVTAFQWNWKFGYQKVVEPGGQVYDGVDATRQSVDQQIIADYKDRTKDGHPQPGPDHGLPADDITYLHYDKVETVGSSQEVPVLVLPTNRVIEFQLASADVIHSFWVPEFLFKRDVFPDPKENHTDNIFQISKIEREGAFVGRCAEMCGTFHSMMNFEVRAVTPEKFDKYMAAREAGETNAEALAGIGESPVAVSTHPFNTSRTSRAASEVQYSK